MKKSITEIARPRAVYAVAKALADGTAPDKLGDVVPAGVDVLDVFDHPEFSGALVAAFHHKMASHHAPKALKALDELLDSGNERIRLQASKLILDKTLPDLSNLQPSSGKDINQMTTAELQHLVDKMENALANRAKVVNPLPNAPVDQGETPDFLS